MKFTLSWLKDHLETDASLDAIHETLSAIGLEVEAVEDHAAALAPFRIASVIEARPHPNADKLRVCMVDAGEGQPVQVVCGAPNARTGMIGVFAPVGTHVPGTGLDLKAGEIRGEASNGMLCSERELMLSDEHDGIIDLPEDAPVGAAYAAWAGLDDPVIEIAITPNRGDCLAVRGIARDLAAAGLGRLKPLAVPDIAGGFESPVPVALDFPRGAEDACPLFVARVFRGVKNGPSPRWLQDRLRAVGLRPISALVDITNLVSVDLCRPLHVFDQAKLGGGLTARFSRPGETILALDEAEYALPPETVVIADAAGPQAIGGVMGGLQSGVTEGTTDVVLEVALFDPIRIATAGRALGLLSDARRRFERGVDPSFAFDAAQIATQLILDLCGGEASQIIHAGAAPEWHRSITLRRGRVAALTGVDVPMARQQEILTALEFTVAATDAGDLTAAPPPWRSDIVGEADLVEEVIRIYGYDAIPDTPPERLGDGAPKPARRPAQARQGAIRRALAARGLDEAVTFSFLHSELAAHFGGGAPALRLLNPISADLDEMRPGLLPNLLSAARRNLDRGLADLGLFEIGPHFTGPRPEDERWGASGLRMGKTGPRWWAGGGQPVDIYAAKADALAALEAAGAPTANLQTARDAPPWMHPGRTGMLTLGPKPLARFGELHPKLVQTMGLKGPVVAFEVVLDAIPPAKARRARPAADLPSLQPVRRDFAFVIAADKPANDLVRAVKGADKALIADVTVFDVYAGEGLAADEKSVGLAVTLQPRDATLTEEGIEAISAAIAAAAEKRCGARLRG